MKRVAVVIRDSDRQFEGLRSSLGLLLEQHEVTMIVLDHPVTMTEAYRDNVGFIDEMEGARYSNVETNVEQHGFRPITLAGLSDLLAGRELIIAF